MKKTAVEFFLTLAIVALTYKVAGRNWGNDAGIVFGVWWGLKITCPFIWD